MEFPQWGYGSLLPHNALSVPQLIGGGKLQVVPHGKEDTNRKTIPGKQFASQRRIAGKKCFIGNPQHFPHPLTILSLSLSLSVSFSPLSLTHIHTHTSTRAEGQQFVLWKGRSDVDEGEMRRRQEELVICCLGSSQSFGLEFKMGWLRTCQLLDGMP